MLSLHNERFGDDLAEPCGACDLCDTPPKLFDGTEAAQKALSAIYRTEERYGVEHLIQVLRGETSDKIVRANHDQLAEQAQRVRNAGGTKTHHDARLVGSLPMETLYAAEQGWTHRGAYKGILSADGETQQKLLAKFVLERCATRTDHYFDVSSAAQLNAVYQEIGSHFLGPRLTE